MSNLHLCEVMYNGLLFPSSEHAYMYAKLETPTDQQYQHCISLTPRAVKQWGQTIQLQPNWNASVKFAAMRNILHDKFERNDGLKQKLLATDSKYIEETNNWSDAIWGVDIDKGGKNMLGKILTEMRNKFRMEESFS